MDAETPMQHPRQASVRGDSPGPQGFPAGSRQVPVPALFFSDVLPAIDDPTELLVSLFAFSLKSRSRAGVWWFTAAELRSQEPLLRALAKWDSDPATAVARGLSLAAARGTLLEAALDADHNEISLYALNTAAARESLARGRELRSVEEDQEAPAAPLENIFVLYEQNIGVISPLLAEQLREAQEEFPWPWIEAAFREAVSLNRRNWRYIERILARWRVEGPDREAIRRSAQSGRRSLAGRYWRLVRR
jgi:DnaD/phage-associated family protein